ncbi:MAG: RluA family pseudouridine synthase [Bacteroidales bacterium]|nr:RluA family pseudouridine synthase [Bacteroidales bacterium]
MTFTSDNLAHEVIKAQLLAENTQQWGNEPSILSEDPDEVAQLYEHFRVVADPGQQLMRVDKFLIVHLPNTSRNRIQAAAKQGFIQVNGRAVKSNYRVKPADVVTLLLDRPVYDNRVDPEDIPLDIVYEDDQVLVINKPAGLCVHPGHGNYTGTLVNAIAWHLRNNPNYDPNDPSVGLVHRIDKNTSGLLVIAKTPEAKAHLGLQFFNKTTHRRYNALVWGNFDESQGRIEGNIARDPRDRMQMAVFAPDSGIGKPAVTHYTIEERFGYVTLISCVLETGRTHQIRAHMKHIGHPLFADARYGGDTILRGTNSSSYRQFVRNGFALCPRQALHAHTLGFVHPTTGEEMHFTTELPEDMRILIERWRQYANSSRSMTD